MALAALGIAVPATLYDDSGLSVRDRLPATLLVRVLRTALTGAHPGLSQLISALPVAGWDGTLADRYRSRGSRVAAGRVRAKTGTLTSVVVLAGVVRNPTGRVLVFAIMLDRASAAGPLPAEEAVDDAVAKLAACTCR
jgi:D-alanyl-D-alanine carboxypeptidase/D-alanyl-D-alanine-endopeptidase (penicillin-binding protein 4)